jgi:hypothetical protein
MRYTLSAYLSAKKASWTLVVISMQISHCVEVSKQANNYYLLLAIKNMTIILHCNDRLYSD